VNSVSFFIYYYNNSVSSDMTETLTAILLEKLL
jgi:hypothetical protein